MNCIFERNDAGQGQRLRCHARYGYRPTRRCDADPEKPKPPPPAPPRAPTTVAAARGPGDYLHDAILRWFGESPTAECQCHSRIAQMNAWGPTGCREHLDEIVGWLVDEAQRRGWRIAKLPVVRWSIKRFVLSAIRRCEGSNRNAVRLERQMP